MADYLTSGPARILSSGTATTFLGQSLSVSFQLIDDSWSRIDFACLQEDPPGEPEVESEARPWGITLTLHDFDGGRGSAVPVLLGEDGDDLYFLHFRVFRYGRTADHTVHWTVYTVSKQEVNWTPNEGFQA